MDIEKVDSALAGAKNAGIQNILALRGGMFNIFDPKTRSLITNSSIIYFAVTSPCRSSYPYHCIYCRSSFGC